MPSINTGEIAMIQLIDGKSNSQGVSANEAIAIKEIFLGGTAALSYSLPFLTLMCMWQPQIGPGVSAPMPLFAAAVAILTVTVAALSLVCRQGHLWTSQQLKQSVCALVVAGAIGGSAFTLACRLAAVFSG